MSDLPGSVTAEHIRESNLIESIDDVHADEELARAWRYVARPGHTHLTLGSVLEAHRIVTADQLGPDAGRLRRVGVMVGGRICPPPEQVSGLLSEWLADMRGWADLDPVAQHVAFERIHPFRDGNGRTGRLLLWWHQMQRDEEPILLRAAERHRYYEWFREPGELDETRRHLLALWERRYEGVDRA